MGYFSWFLAWPDHCCYVERLLIFILLFCLKYISGIRGFLVESIGDPLSMSPAKRDIRTFSLPGSLSSVSSCFPITIAKIQALYWARALRARFCLKPDVGWDVSIASSIEYNVGLRVDIRSLYCAWVCCYKGTLNSLTSLLHRLRRPGGLCLTFSTLSLFLMYLFNPHLCDETCLIMLYPLHVFLKPACKHFSDNPGLTECIWECALSLFHVEQFEEYCH